MRLVAAIVLAFAAALLTAGAAAAAGPAVAVDSVRVSASSAGVVAGSRIRVSDTTRNRRPRGRTRRTLTVYLASRDRRASAGDTRIGTRRVKPLRAGRGSSALGRPAIPTATPAGTYFVIACAGAAPKASRYTAGACRTAPKPVRILSAAPTPVAPPAVAGVAIDGQALTAGTGSWRGIAPLTYSLQWRRCDATGGGCVDIEGATDQQYTLTPADVGSTLRASATATNAYGAVASGSAPTAPVAAIPPAVTSAPAIAGTGLVGEPLTADTGAWAGTPQLAYSFAWQRCNAGGDACADIAGATGRTYDVTAADPGSTLRVQVTAANAGGSAAAASAPAPASAYRNPVFGSDLAPDPFVLDDGGTHSDYWAYTTGDRFPMLRSSDLVHWRSAGTAFAQRPDWVVDRPEWHPWAPSVLRTDRACPGGGGDHCYLMYYVGLSRAYDVNCVAVATATAAGGPYTDRGPLVDPSSASAQPIGCGDASGQGNIDPSPYVDADGSAYLYVSTDFATGGGSARLEPTISAIPLAPDLATAAGPRAPLLTGDAGSWEAAGAFAPTVEAPFVQRRGDTFYLFYSGGSWFGAYGMSYATGASPTGPFTKSPAGPILSETAAVRSPGGGDIPVTGPHGGTWIAYHGRDSTRENPRTLRLDRFSWQRSPDAGAADVPAIAGPTSAAQPALP